VFEFRSGLVDLVVGVGCHFGGGHRFALADERFVGLVAEDITEMVIAVQISRVHAAARGLTLANPAN
jgi:hypothetical protein